MLEVGKEPPPPMQTFGSGRSVWAWPDSASGLFGFGAFATCCKEYRNNNSRSNPNNRSAISTAESGRSW